MKLKHLLPFALLFIMGISYASTLYIGNKDAVIVRENPSEQSNVVTQLTQGMPVELLKSNLSNGYSYIKTQKNELGWVPTEYLVSGTPPQPESTFHKFWSRLAFWHQSTATPMSSTIPSTTAISLISNNASLRQNQAVITAQLNNLQTQIDTIQNATHWKWFYYGVLVAFLCFVLGYFLGGCYRRRERKWFK